ncbi:cyclin H [Entomortierella parvispora]|uniref:Cyclin H n=1 Tax=Entomortierella parvispora TaxID=205924 RepID=A0A9P3M1Y9_9FUNG|nr:cyclin H [Entomortierella parvispora]
MTNTAATTATTAAAAAAPTDSTTVTTANGSVVNATDANVTADAVKEVPTMKQLYEQSTQYNHWRYTQAALDEMRNKVNTEAAANIKANINEERALQGAQGIAAEALPLDLEFLRVDEELALLGFYERKIAPIFKHWKLPPYVVATAVAYMKRFYLENTVVDYHPKDVMLTCMFLARKTENFLMTIEDFCAVPRCDPRAILDLEFLICKNLRFHFTVHHPYRPCLGFFFDMQAVTDSMEKLQRVYEGALRIIDTSLHTDLCFLYQPSQIALAAMRISCKEESYDFEKYAEYKFKANEAAAQKYNEILLPILLAIETVMQTDPRCVVVTKTAATEINRRLKTCQDPARNPISLLYHKRKRQESNGDDDDDDDGDDDKPDKRAKLEDDSSPE